MTPEQAMHALTDIFNGLSTAATDGMQSTALTLDNNESSQAKAWSLPT